MKRELLFFLGFTFSWFPLYAQEGYNPVTFPAITDSITVRAHPVYDNVTKVHRFLFGENYRKEWAAPVRLPVFRLSDLGLIALERGGGHQTHSLRLKDKNGKEWVLRSIEKYPEILLPQKLRKTFAAAWLKDAMSAQNPYAPVVVPVISEGADVPHSNPTIGWVDADKNLGLYEKEFANTLCLLEEREPYGNSDNSLKMFQRLDDDNDNSADTIAFFRARLLDLFIGDWDRHVDQWRWLPEKNGNKRKYLGIPRDRDQAFYKNEGFFPSLASRKWVAPYLKGFDSDIKLGNEFFFEGSPLDTRLLVQINYNRWMQIANDFVSTLTDPLLVSALNHLPKEVWEIRQTELLQKMKERRSHIVQAMSNYYHFINRIVDIKMSNKNELIEINDLDVPYGSLTVTIHKLTAEGNVKNLLFNKTFDPAVTKEIRIFAGKGNDSIVLNNQHSRIKLRLVGGDGNKLYNVFKARRPAQVFEKMNTAVFQGQTKRLRKHLSDDSVNTAFVHTNLYNRTAPLFTGGYNADDGLLLGAGISYTHQGFRKRPYGSNQRFIIEHSFSTRAFKAVYKAEWLNAVGKADFTVDAFAFAPKNTQNFFGAGNETLFSKNGDYKRYYRTRFTLYRLEPALRWRKGETRITVGPSFQYYHYDSSDNKGRFIHDVKLMNTYDSNTISNDKTHLGLMINLTNDSRDDDILPTNGFYSNIRLQGYNGLNAYSKAFVQIIPEIAVYKSVNKDSTIVLADRLGGTVTFGNTAFYQSAFLGGNGNLLGYRKYRFAGRQMLYNNLECRIKIADFASYILPGEIGLLAFVDAGRVWVKNENSSTWHNGYGGGVYFAPARIAVLQAVAGHSSEGWYPYISLGFRF
jgi:hypothetical protein